MSAAPWSVTLPGASIRLTFQPADAAVHATLVHDWMNRPHVVPWWQLDRPLDGIRQYLAGLTHLSPWIVAADGHPFGYVETYRVLDDPLAAFLPRVDLGVSGPSIGHTGLRMPRNSKINAGEGARTLAARYSAGPADLGWHVLVGPAELMGAGPPRLLGRAAVAYLFAQGADRVVCEPDVRNERMIAFCHRLGHERLADVDLPEKRAALMVCAKDAFDARWPGDRAAVEEGTT